MIFLKQIIIFNFRNTIIVLTITVHIESNVNEINADRNKHTCKIFIYLPYSVPLHWLIQPLMIFDNPDHGTS